VLNSNTLCLSMKLPEDYSSRKIEFCWFKVVHKIYLFACFCVNVNNWWYYYQVSSFFSLNHKIKVKILQFWYLPIDESQYKQKLLTNENQSLKNNLHFYLLFHILSLPFSLHWLCAALAILLFFCLSMTLECGDLVLYLLSSKCWSIL